MLHIQNQTDFQKLWSSWTILLHKAVVMELTKRFIQILFDDQLALAHLLKVYSTGPITPSRNHGMMGGWTEKKVALFCCEINCNS